MKTKLIIFGLTGDLSRRKLLPALEHIIDSGEKDISVIGVSRREVDVPELLQSSIGRSDLAEVFSVVTMDLATPEDYNRLKEAVNLQDNEQAVIYLSVPPSAAADIVDFLGRAGLNTPNVKLLFEKPFGFDLESAKDYIERTARYFDEAQIYRIDHYMAKDIAQEIIELRKGREWDSGSIGSIDIVASETIGVEDRAVFYEETGALRDFLQGHLLQLLSLVLMNVPTDYDEAKLATYRLGALENIEPADPAETLRAQYEGYQEEVGNPGSKVETFVATKLHSIDPTWEGVTFRLITGKSLDEKRSYIKIHYNDGTNELFEEGKTESADGVKLDAYERVLLEAIKGHKPIFITSPEIIRAWEIVRPLQEAWDMDEAPLSYYTPGSTIEQVRENAG